MLAHQSLSIDIPAGLLGVFIGISFGFVIGLFYYQTYRKPYYWCYSIFSSLIAAVITPFVLHQILRMDTTTIHAIMAQFGAALVATVLANHLLYILKKRHKIRQRHSRHRRYVQDLNVAGAHHSVTHGL